MKINFENAEQILISWNVEHSIIKKCKELNGKLPHLEIEQSYLEYFCSFVESRGYHDFYECFKKPAANMDMVAAFYLTIEKLSTSFHSMTDKTIILRSFKVKKKLCEKKKNYVKKKKIL